MKAVTINEFGGRVKLSFTDFRQCSAHLSEGLADAVLIFNHRMPQIVFPHFTKSDSGGNRHIGLLHQLQSKLH